MPNGEPRLDVQVHTMGCVGSTRTPLDGVGWPRAARNAAQGAKRAAVAGNGAVGCPRIDDDDPPIGKGTPGIGCLLGLAYHQPGNLDGLLDLHSARYQFLECARPAGKIVSPGPGEIERDLDLQSLAGNLSNERRYRFHGPHVEAYSMLSRCETFQAQLSPSKRGGIPQAIRDGRLHVTKGHKRRLGDLGT